jgi:hypothetical protein
MNPALVAGIFALAWWLMKTPKGPSGSSATEDQLYLARLLTIEAGDQPPNPEHVAIAQVAWNRSQRRKVPVKTVVASTSWFGRGAAARKRIEQLNQVSPLPGGKMTDDHQHFPGYLRVARDITSGAGSSPIGKREHFVHIGSMPRAPEGIANGDPIGTKFINIDGRKVPKWAVSKSAGGTARYEPMRVGRATFA